MLRLLSVVVRTTLWSQLEMVVEVGQREVGEGQDKIEGRMKVHLARSLPASLSAGTTG